MRFDQFSSCERLFLEGGSHYHLCTKPIEIDLLFRTPEELDEALNLIAFAVFATNCRLLAFAVMSNHLHFVIEGSLSSCEAFFSHFHALLSKYLSRCGRFDLAQKCTPAYVPINNLKQLKDEIAYVVRNPYVASSNVNMFSYRWCSGHLYFNGLSELMEKGVNMSEQQLKNRRIFTHTRSGTVDSRLLAINGTALPACFVDYHRAENFFDNARDFQYCMMKNVESQVAIAKRIGDTLFLDDNEMWELSYKLCRETYKVKSPFILKGEERITLAKTLKFEYGASNKQIARCTGMDRSYVDEIFPMSAKP